MTNKMRIRFLLNLMRGSPLLLHQSYVSFVFLSLRL